jgi:hypothetical protein
MRLNRWVYAAASMGMMGAGVLAEQACSTGNYCTGSGSDMTCFLYTESPTDAGKAAGQDAMTARKDAGADANASAPYSYTTGDGGPCTGPVGGFPPPRCDPSDETAPVCSTPFDAGCNLSPKCGDLTTCEPFVKNPAPSAGVDNFRMRLINITAPPALAKQAIQGGVVTPAVELPSVTAAGVGGAPCGENGSGLFNWLLSVNQTAKTVTTGGAPPSTDPFGLGYCYLNATVNGLPIGPVNLKAMFTGNTFSTVPLTGATPLNIPIFVAPMTAGGPYGAIILPILGASLNEVTITSDGNCIGEVNNLSIQPPMPGVACSETPLIQTGVDSCSHWHTDGTLGGYITLKAADAIPIVVLGGESLCVILTSEQKDGSSPATCSTGGLTAGDYCSPKDGVAGHACTNGDSMWLSAEFAASAVNITDDKSITLCNGGSIGGADGG